MAPAGARAGRSGRLAAPGAARGLKLALRLVLMLVLVLGLIQLPVLVLEPVLVLVLALALVPALAIPPGLSLELDSGWAPALGRATAIAAALVMATGSGRIRRPPTQVARSHGHRARLRPERRAQALHRGGAPLGMRAARRLCGAQVRRTRRCRRRRRPGRWRSPWAGRWRGGRRAAWLARSAHGRRARCPRTDGRRTGRRAQRCWQARGRTGR